jgi:two-component system OmpR family response regulator
MKVLLVEDSEAIETQLRSVFDAIPQAEVIEVFATGRQASEWLHQHPDAWDLAVIDLFLRQGHGCDVLRQCRRRRPHQKAVVLSNYSREPVAQYARLAGADAFFDKSLELERFVQFCLSQSQSSAKHPPVRSS